MKNIYKKELNYYLNNPIGYIIIVLFAVFINFLFVKDIFPTGSASMKPFFNLVPWLMLVFIPAITMRSISEEKRINTIETLLTLPISETQIVIGKFLSLLTLVIISLLLTTAVPLLLSFFSKVYFPEIIVGYLGVILLASLYISISLFFSSQTKNQVIAFLISAIALFILTVLGTDFISPFLPKFLQDSLSYFSPLYHLQTFVKGVIDLRPLLYFITFITMFLFFTIIDIEKRN